MLYYETREARKKGAEPNRGNFIALSAYRLVLPAQAAGALRLEPISKVRRAAAVREARKPLPPPSPSHSSFVRRRRRMPPPTSACGSLR